MQYIMEKLKDFDKQFNSSVGLEYKDVTSLGCA